MFFYYHIHICVCFLFLFFLLFLCCFFTGVESLKPNLCSHVNFNCSREFQTDEGQNELSYVFSKNFTTIKVKNEIY